MRRFEKTETGFTLVEILLVISIIGIASALSAPIFSKTRDRNNLAIAENSARQLFRHAQILSRAGHQDDSWGVRIESNRFVLFKGASFVGRDADFDEEFDMPSHVDTSGLSSRL